MNIQKLMQQAQAMQKKMEQIQQDLSAKQFTGTSGGGKVSFTIYGNGQTKSVVIAEALLAPEYKESLEDLIAAAANAARRAADEEAASAMGGLGLPAGLKLPF